MGQNSNIIPLSYEQAIVGKGALFLNILRKNRPFQVSDNCGVPQHVTPAIIYNASSGQQRSCISTPLWPHFCLPLRICKTSDPVFRSAFKQPCSHLDSYSAGLGSIAMELRTCGLQLGYLAKQQKQDYHSHLSLTFFSPESGNETLLSRCPLYMQRKAMTLSLKTQVNKQDLNAQSCFSTHHFITSQFNHASM